jgi:release factor glutamine methyltransferase
MNVNSWLKESPIQRLDSELIVAHILGKERSFLHAHPEYEFSETELAQIRAATERRASGEPLAYTLGYKEFYGRIFKVTKDTLIPRPETEVLVIEAISLRPKSILDVGTGSGCIAVTLSKELPGVSISAIDISKEALAVAKENAQKHHAQIAFMQSDLLSNLHKAQKYDLIIANLPYVDKNWTWLGAELSFEPESALFAEDGGLELIKKIILQAPSRLNPHGYLLLEADQIQHQTIIDFAQKSGYFESVKKADEKSALALVLQLR